MKNTIYLFLLLTLTLTGCQLIMGTILLVRGTDEAPKYDFLRKGEKRVVIVPRSVYSHSLEVQNAPREIARHINDLLDDPQNTKNKKLRVVEQMKVEAWLDRVHNDFDTFLEVGRDPSIQADIVIGFDIIEFRIRDPLNSSLIQGKCVVEVRAFDCATGKPLASETLTIIDPPNVPLQGNPRMETQFRAQFISVIAQQIAALFHHHNPNRIQRIDADNLEMHRIQ
jgi:hypothetical protein